MRAVIQRVSAADVVVNGGAPRAIGRGLMILLGVRDTDTLDVCEKLAQKCAGLRIFEDAITFKIALMVAKYMKYMESLDY